MNRVENKSSQYFFVNSVVIGFHCLSRYFFCCSFGCSKRKESLCQKKYVGKVFLFLNCLVHFSVGLSLVIALVNISNQDKVREVVSMGSVCSLI